MAGVGAAWPGASANPLGRLARAQYGALARMRLRLLLNGLRTSEGALEQGARWAGVATYGVLGFGIGVGAGWAAYTLIERGAWEALPVEFWFVCVLWQTVSVALASFQEQHETGGLLRFPVNFGSYFILSMVSTLLMPSTLLGVLGSVGILAGATLARPGMFGWSAVAVAAFVAFNLLLTQAVLSWAERWLAQRKVREFIGGAFLLAVICLQFLNPAVIPLKGDDLTRPPARAIDGPIEVHLAPLVTGVGRVQAWLPPGLEARALEQAGRQHHGKVARTLGMLGFYVLLAGGVLAVRLRADFRGEPAATVSEPETAAPERRRRSRGGASVEGATIVKELRTLRRSLAQLYVLGTPVAMVLVIASLLRSAEDWAKFGLPMCVAYALLGFAQPMYNNLGVDAEGVQLLLMAPVRMWRVVLAKNALHGLLYTAVALAAAGIARLQLGAGATALSLATAAWVVFALGANLAAGNYVSVKLPFRMNHGQLGRQRGSQANGLVGMGIQLVVAAAGAAALVAGAAAGLWWLAPALLGVLGGAAWAAWWHGLRRSDARIQAHRDRLMARLVRTN